VTTKKELFGVISKKFLVEVCYMVTIFGWKGLL